MKKTIHAFFMAWGMFTAIPCPYRPWDEAERQRMILMLPVIGIVIGAIWTGAGMLGKLLHIPQFLMAAIMTILPHLLTGFLHLDGYMDVCDAVLSRRNAEERRRILKDSHVGSFAVIMLGILFLVSYGDFASVTEQTDLRILLFFPATVRACAGMALSALKPLPTSQYYREAAPQRKKAYFLIPCGIFVLLLVGSMLLCGGAGVFCVAVAAAGYWCAIAWAYHDLGGMSGDISGFGTVVGELAGVTAMVFAGGIL